VRVVFGYERLFRSGVNSLDEMAVDSQFQTDEMYEKRRDRYRLHPCSSPCVPADEQ